LRGAHCPAPLCCPSRAAFASGRYGVNTGCFTNLHQLPPGTPTHVSQFRDAGYKTAVVVQQIYIRWKRGQTRDARFAQMAPRVEALAESALALAERSGL